MMVPICEGCRAPIKPSFLKRYKHFVCPECGHWYLACPRDWEEAMYLIEIDGKLVFRAPFKLPSFLDWTQVVPT